jgi:hypothetical protein
MNPNEFCIWLGPFGDATTNGFPSCSSWRPKEPSKLSSLFFARHLAHVQIQARVRDILKYVVSILCRNQLFKFSLQAPLLSTKQPLPLTKVLKNSILSLFFAYWKIYLFPIENCIWLCYRHRKQNLLKIKSILIPSWNCKIATVQK